MASTIKPKRSTTPGAVPTTANLADGEMAFNIPDKKIYIRNGSNVYPMTMGYTGMYGEDGVQVYNDGDLAVVALDALAQAAIFTGFLPEVNALTRPPNSVLWINGSGALASSPVTQTGMNVLTIPPVADTVHYTMNSSGAAAIYTVTSWFRGFSGSATAAAARTALGLTVSKDHIKGLMISTTATTITVSPGEFCTPAGDIVTVPSGLSIAAGVARTVNTTYHLYISPAGVLSRVTNAPTALLAGCQFARASSGDSTLRYIGSVRTAPSGTANYLLQSSDGGDNQVEVSFHFNTGLPTSTATTGGGRIVAGGVHPTTATDVSAATLAPATVTNYLCMVIRNINTLGSIVRYFSFAPGTGFQPLVPTGNTPMGVISLNLRCDSTPKIQYDVPAGSSDTAYIDCVGYGYLR